MRVCRVGKIIVPLSLELGPVMLDIAGTELTQIDIDRLSHPLVGGVILFTKLFECRAIITVNPAHPCAQNAAAINRS